MTPEPKPSSKPGSALSPLRHRIFLAIWLASMVSNFGALIQSVGAAWLMTTIAPSADMVALVQASTTLPILILALLSGAVADVFDRRWVMLAAQGLMLAASAGLAALAFLELITPWSLLALTFLVGCGTALHAPSWQASVGEQVPREELAGAVALNSLGFNVARTLGPAIGGAIVAVGGPTATFVVNAFTYTGLITVLLLWRPHRPPRSLPPESLGGAIGAGLRYARRAPVVRTVLGRALAFGAAGAAVWALMPLIAREMLGQGPATFGFLLGAFGVGAVCGAFASTGLRRRMPVETLVRGAIAAFGLAILLVAVSRFLPFTLVALFIGGAAWVLTLSSFNVSIQMAAPRWVVGRAMSLFQMSTFGGMAVGSWAWGHLAEATSIALALGASGAAVLATVLIGLRRPLPEIENLDLSPLRGGSQPSVSLAPQPHHGPVVVTIEYRIRPDQAAAFVGAMREKRRIRQRDGARQWTLLQDLADPELWVERFHTPTWVEHLRQRARVTSADREIEERVRAFHSGSEPPHVRRLIARPLDAADATLTTSGGADPNLPQAPLS